MSPTLLLDRTGTPVQLDPNEQLFLRHEIALLLSPREIAREKEFLQGLGLLLGAIYSAPWLYFGLTALVNSDDSLLHWPFLWRLALALTFGWYHHASCVKHWGPWYPLDKSRSAIMRRQHIRRHLDSLQTSSLP